MEPLCLVIGRGVPVSPLVLLDRLIMLAEAAEGGGYVDAAKRLLELAYAVLDGESRVSSADAHDQGSATRRPT
jgi:hypothetical protein